MHHVSCTVRTVADYFSTDQLSMVSFAIMLTLTARPVEPIITNPALANVIAIYSMFHNIFSCILTTSSKYHSLSVWFLVHRLMTLSISKYIFVSNVYFVFKRNPRKPIQLRVPLNYTIFYGINPASRPTPRYSLQIYSEGPSLPLCMVCICHLLILQYTLYINCSRNLLTRILKYCIIQRYLCWVSCPHLWDKTIQKRPHAVWTADCMSHFTRTTVLIVTGHRTKYILKL